MASRHVRVSDPREFVHTTELLEQETLEAYDRDALMGAQLHMFLNASPSEIDAWVTMAADRAAVDSFDHRDEEDLRSHARFLTALAHERFDH
jgi:hypothetical protein